MMKTWEFTTIDGQVRYCLAPDLESAIWEAAKLSDGTHNLKDIVLHEGIPE